VVADEFDPAGGLRDDIWRTAERRFEERPG
jgi:hypothetical protein